MIVAAALPRIATNSRAKIVAKGHVAPPYQAVVVVVVVVAVAAVAVAAAAVVDHFATTATTSRDGAPAFARPRPATLAC